MRTISRRNRDSDTALRIVSLDRAAQISSISFDVEVGVRLSQFANDHRLVAHSSSIYIEQTQVRELGVVYKLDVVYTNKLASKST